MTEERNYGNEVGNVIWFDSKKGFGFVKIITPGSKYYNEEIFIHYSSIQSESDFKKLYPGENISLDINEEEGDDKKKYTIRNVTGLYGTQLMIDNSKYLLKVMKKRDLQDLN